MIEIDITRYAKVGRADVLALLESAQMTPDGLIAHRDRSFTARYLRDRSAHFESEYESKMEAADRRFAIFKRPNKRLDRGRYLTLTFAMAETTKLGLPEVTKSKPKSAPALKANGHSPKTSIPVQTTPVPVPSVVTQIDTAMVVKMLQRVSNDMFQLVHHATELATKTKTDQPESEHLLTSLSELGEQTVLLNIALKHLEQVQTTSY
ncbi:MAG: hypothetical protein H7Y09_06810 [Chitinophagaceae bacterium]|nr:hypothetical protein [Anaerolineae bacterium]